MQSRFTSYLHTNKMNFINRKAQGSIGLLSGVVLTIVGVAFVLIGLFIGQELMTEINSSLGAGGATGATLYATANATPGMAAAWTTYGNVQSAFTLCGIAFIVIGASMIISILKSAF